MGPCVVSKSDTGAISETVPARGTPLWGSLLGDLKFLKTQNFGGVMDLRGIRDLAEAGPPGWA